MKIIAYTEQKQNKEQVLLLKLVKNEGHRDSPVILTACYKNGVPIPGGNIIMISEKGVRRCPSLSKKIGLPLYNDSIVKLY